MEFANFDEFMKAMDYLRNMGKPKRSSKQCNPVARKPNRSESPATEDLIAKATRLDKAAEKLLKISQSKERAYESRKVAAHAKKSKRSRRPGFTD